MYEVKAYINCEDKVIVASEGDGSNLWQEDIDAGYVDYVYYTVFDITDMFNVKECDGGMMLLTRPFNEVYKWKTSSDEEPDLIDDEKVLDDIVGFAFGADARYKRLF